MDGWLVIVSGSREPSEYVWEYSVQLYYLYTEVVGSIVDCCLIICGCNDASHQRRGSNSGPEAVTGIC